MKLPILSLLTISALAFVAYLSAGDLASAAEATHEYQIAANDGYGIEDCLSSGSECGHVVADAWCEAHGNGPAVAFGLRSALDTSATQVSAKDEPYVIRCGD